MRKRLKEKMNKLVELFERQLTTLKELKCSEEIINILEHSRHNVISYCLRINIPPNRIPFLPVITPAYYKIDKLMSMIKYNENPGYVYPDMGGDRYPVYDVITQSGHSIPFDPYYIISVENGKRTLGKYPNKAFYQIRMEGNEALTAAECASLAMFSAVLAKQSLWTGGSRWENGTQILRINLIRGQAQLINEHISISGSDTGMPYCKARVA